MPQPPGGGNNGGGNNGGGNNGGGNNSGGLPTIDGDNSANILAGTSEDELIRGKRGDDTLFGAGGDDILEGGQGNDVLITSEGPDVLDGGADFDTAWYRIATTVNVNEIAYGDYLSVFGYDIVIGAGTTTITDIDLSDGDTNTDTLIDVEQAVFWDDDADGDGIASTIAVHLDGTNNAALAVKDTIGGLDEDSLALVTSAALLTNDLEFDGEAIVISAVDTSATAGTTTVNFDVDGTVASIDYDPTAAFDYLAAGEVATDTFTYTVADPNGEGTTALVTLTIAGINDAPVVDPIAQTDLTETTDTSPITGNISVTFTDVDLTDVGHTAMVTSTGTSGVTSGLTLDAAGLAALVTPGAVSKASGSTSGSVTLAFSAAYTVFNYLAAGETATLSYEVLIDDMDGGQTSQSFDVVVTGTNDVPWNSIGFPDGGTVTEYPDGDPLEGTLRTVFDAAEGFGGRAGGGFWVRDHDLSDHGQFTASVTPLGSDYLSDLQVTSIDINFPTASVLNWTFSVSDADLDFLGAGESVDEVFRITVDDNNGGTTFRDMTITLVGSNDAPTLSVIATQPGVEDTAQTFTFADLLAASDGADVDDGIVALRVESLMSGSLVIVGGGAAGPGTLITTEQSVEWTPDTNSDGQNTAFSVVAVDAFGADSGTPVDLNVELAAVADVPTLFGADTAIGMAAVGAEVQANTHALSSQAWSSVSGLVGGGYVTVWQSFGQDGSSWSVHGQVYDATGDTVGSEFQVNTFTTFQQSFAQVAALHDGGFVVTYRSSLLDGDSWGSFARIYDSNGVAPQPEFQVNTYTTSEQRQPTVATLADGGYVITWQSLNQDGSGFGIYGQRYDAAGNTEGTEFQVNTTTIGDQSFPDIAALDDGGFIITWQSDGQDGSGLGIYGQRFDVAGVPDPAGEFQINTTAAGAQTFASVTTLSDGRFAVIWQSDGQDGFGSGVYGQIFDDSANPIGMEFQINTTPANNEVQSETLASIAALSGGGFVAVWASDGQDGSGFGVYGQLFDPEGNKVEDEFQLSSSATGNQNRPSVAALEDGGFAVSWDTGDSFGSNGEIFVRRFAPVVDEDTPVALNISAALMDTDGSESLSITIEGVPTGASLSAGVDLGGGVWSLTPAELAGLIFTPAPHSADTVNLSVTATATEAANANSASSVEHITIFYKPVADAPSLIVAPAAGNEDTAIALSVDPALVDQDGSESLAVMASAIPEGSTLSDGTNSFLAAAGSTEVDVTDWTLAALTITPPENSDADFQLSVTATATEAANGDAAQTIDAIDVTVSAVADFLKQNITDGGNGDSFLPAISADGSIVVFESNASNLIPGQVEPKLSFRDIFIFDVATTNLTNITQGGDGGSSLAAISGDGSTIVFSSNATNLISGQVDLNASYQDIFIFDVATTNLTNITQGGDFQSSSPAISADGSTIVFYSHATNLIPGQPDHNGTVADIFIYDIATETMTNITDGGNDHSFVPVVSADGSTIVFWSNATNLVAGQVDANGNVADTFLYDVATGTTTNITDGGNSDSQQPVISADGSIVVFSSTATNLVDGQVDINGSVSDIFLYDVETGTTTNITDGGNSDSQQPVISADGSIVTFSSAAADLVDGQADVNGDVSDTFLYDVATGTTTNITDDGNAVSESPTISPDGSMIAFHSFATNLIDGQADANGPTADIFLYEWI